MSMMMISWEECEAKLKSIRDSLEHNPVIWDNAEILRNEILKNGPDVEFRKVDEGKPLPANDYELELFTKHLRDLGSAFNKKDKADAMEKLLRVQNSLGMLKRRTQAS